MKVQIRNMGESAVELKTMGPKEMMAALGTLLTKQSTIVETPSENEIRVQEVKEPTNLAAERPRWSVEWSEEAAEEINTGAILPFTGTIVDARVTVVDGFIKEVNDRPVNNAMYTWSKELKRSE